MYDVDRYFIVSTKFKIMNISDIEKYDVEKMHEVYDNWPKLAKQEYEKVREHIDFGEISHVVFAGMGGSGAIGDIFSAILSKTNIHVEVIKGYTLPKTVNSKSLVVITSVSGNTDETINVLESATKSNCKLIAFSSGGKIEKFCKNNEINFRKIQMIHSPRGSFPLFLFGILNVLEPFLPIKKEDVIISLKNLEKLKEKISSCNLSNENPAILLAKWISGVPIIYYPWGLQASAIRFKNSLQENVKIHAITEDIIESCHNGIVAWDRPSSNVQPILIQGDKDYFKTKERCKIIKEFFKIKEIKYYEIINTDENILSKLINLIYLLDYATIYKAVLLQRNPTPVESIDFIKRKLMD
jgi:glucose/mannose-6-phosphate isomerase